MNSGPQVQASETRVSSSVLAPRWLQFSLRTLLLGALLTCVLVAVFRPRPEPAPPPYLFVEQQFYPGHNLYERTYSVEFSNGDKEVYWDTKPYGSLNNVLIQEGTKRQYYYDHVKTGPKRVTPEMHERYGELLEKADSTFDADSWPYDKKVRIELPRDFPSYRQSLAQRKDTKQAADRLK